MQLDSYRRRPSLPVTSTTQSVRPACSVETTTADADDNMPCSYSRCCKATTFKTEDGIEMETWHAIRRNNLRNMRRMVKRVVLYMALLEAIKAGPDVLVFAGRHGYPERGPEDYGVAYCAGYMLSWIYLCIFSIVWKPFFSWWVTPSKSDPESPAKVDKVASFLKQVNMVLLPLSIGLSLVEYAVYAVRTLIYVDSRPVDSCKLPKNTQKNWLARLMLLVGVFVSTTCGYGVLQVLAEFDLAHVKQLEYMIIILPIQINLGVLLGSAMQWRMEKRIQAKANAAKAIEIGSTDEKAALLEV